MTLFSLDGQVALITGSSRGIGRAAAEEMAANGARVVISSRKADACEAVAAAINDRHGERRAIACAANIGVRADLERLVATTRDAFGRIDALVCNAASNPYYGPMAEIADEQFQKIFQNNVLSTHWLTQMVAPEMIARGDGSIILVSSIGGMIGSGVIGAYNVSKAADMQLARNLAVEFGPHGVRVNCIAPGVTRTEFAAALWQDPRREAAINAATPLRRIGEPEDIAGAIAFLAMPASRYMTGQVLVLDGGVMIAGGGV
jgi:hypothetical protein